MFCRGLASVIYKEKTWIMLPELTAGALDRIVNGENVANAVVQLLGCKRIPGIEGDRYRLLISDGVTGNPFVMLGTRLNHMVVNNELKQFTILQIDEYVCNDLAMDRLVIVLRKLTVLVPGNEVNEKLGNPVNSSTGHASARAVTNASVKAGSVQSMMQMMFPELTNGAINRILNGEDVTNAVIQILGLEKIGCAGKYCYSLLISDGVTGCPFALLGPELNHLVANKELEEFAIIQVDKCTCEEIVDRKAIVLLKFTVVVPGNEVNEKLGNPDIPTIDTRAEPAVNAAELVLLSQLTNGAIVRILGDEDVENAVVLIIAAKKMPERGDDLYHVTIFDGVMAWPFTKLGRQLNHFGENKKNTKFPVRIDKYVCNQVSGKPMEIILLGLTVLGPEKELENPVNLSDVGATTGAMHQLKIV